ncbi:glycosyltransferase [Pseudotamlana carrageenivorans]|uniref:Glycosyl transferase family 1 n=1 Tax=Pseudotamlana carrageenivorans TaxID=2069432 RepID=A0A2I7SE23_9FLAO|nr:glycosyltransferase [Tamlana carrageenivorans]AUS04130.1 glycosyl transferase family 1 [Tamlana carrageenivorans]
MKILMVAIPNHHFFQWVNQLKDSGFEVCWFDITDGGPPSNKISWVKQIKGWKLRWDYPFRTRIKKNYPNLYRFLQRFNEESVSKSFEATLKSFKPDVIHCFEMQLSGLPILSVLQRYKVPLIYSSWGSDMYHYCYLGMTNLEVSSFLERVNYLITDCNRDVSIAKNNGFKGEFLGVYPGNGGLSIQPQAIKPLDQRKIIMVKGYNNGVGQAIVVLKAMALLPQSYFKDYTLTIYSADKIVEDFIAKTPYFHKLKIKIYSRFSFVDNQVLLNIMGESVLHIASSISDGMPNALLEAMAMGSFPIQSNPGRVTEEVITHGKNGFLISDPLNAQALSLLIEIALNDVKLRQNAQEYNVKYMKAYYNRSVLKPQIVELYQSILA